MSTVETQLIGLLEQWCIKHEIPEDHGIEHYIRVYTYAKRGMLSQLTPDQQVAVLLACLLHDVDDRKLKLNVTPLHSEEKLSNPLMMSYPIATHFLNEVKAGVEIREMVLEMIDLVSTSKNGNRQPPEQWMLIPRDCDRLDALGLMGVKRCYDYTVRKGLPLVTPTTPLPCNNIELKEVLKTRSLDQYVAGGGISASMLDHYLDKLFHLQMGSGSHVLEAIYLEEMRHIEQSFFDYAKVFSRCHLTVPLYGKSS